MRQRIRIRERLPIWGLRLILGVILTTLSELVMWPNPPAHALFDWPVLLVLYVALAAILMDLTVRFQARGIATILLVSGLCGLVSGAIINRSTFSALPYSLIAQGLGMQTGAMLFGLLLYVSIMRGKQVNALQVAAAAALGVLWGIWVHWSPLRSSAKWGLVPIETAQLYMLPALLLIGALVAVAAPRFRFFREKQMELAWWETIVAGAPLFIVLIVGMLQSIIPFLWMIAVIAIGGFIVWTLFQSRGGYEPSILAEALFAAPNTITYIVLAITFLMAGTIAYNFVTDADSPVGIVVYLIILACGFAWLPGASILLLLQVLRQQRAPVEPEDKKDE
jgi:hypothetical protein